ncbi:Nattectin [Aphelenchoides avenae]|nr:Nattectin [Aphelenchus avenae]
MDLRIAFLLLAVVVVVQASSVTLKAKGKCPEFQLRRPDHCLKVGFGQKNWQDAEADCVSAGGHLASIPDESEEAYFWRYLLAAWRDKIWLGGRQQSDGKWTWSDGSSFNYTEWAPGQPSSNGAHVCPSSCAGQAENLCLALEYESGKWAARDCGGVKIYFCRLPFVAQNNAVKANELSER